MFVYPNRRRLKLLLTDDQAKHHAVNIRGIVRHVTHGDIYLKGPNEGGSQLIGKDDGVSNLMSFLE